jgi:hypothetical protein
MICRCCCRDHERRIHVASPSLAGPLAGRFRAIDKFADSPTQLSKEPRTKCTHGVSGFLPHRPTHALRAAFHRRPNCHAPARANSGVKPGRERISVSAHVPVSRSRPGFTLTSRFHAHVPVSRSRPGFTLRTQSTASRPPAPAIDPATRMEAGPRAGQPLAVTKWREGESSGASAEQNGTEWNSDRVFHSIRFMS